MTTTTLSPSFTLTHDAVAAYASNVADAALGLWSALLAKRPRQQEAAADRYAREKASPRREAFAMAYDYDDTNPALAAELRLISAR